MIVMERDCFHTRYIKMGHEMDSDIYLIIE
jgi:hypothetical protein